MNRKAVAYLRVSTDQQANHGVSLAAQQAKLKAYAELYDIDIMEYVVDPAESAKNLKRPKLQYALNQLGKTADALIVVKLDRLTRSVVDIGYLVEKYFKKYNLLSVSEQIDTRSSAGMLVLNVLASVSQWEREAISERTKAALQYKKSRGEAISWNTAYGYKKDGKLVVPCPDEQQMIERMRELYQTGSNYSQIAQMFKTRSGVPMTGVQVKRLVSECA